MEALSIVPGEGVPRLTERPEPEIEAPDDIKICIRRVGICGTDREQAEGGRALAPKGHSDLVIGHEMFGEVVEVGDAVTRVAPGDGAAFTVRRPTQIAGAQLMRRLVLGNQLLVGSVNAARDHFQMAVEDLRRAQAHWPGHAETLITHHYPHTVFADALHGHAGGAIKSVLEWD